MRLNLCTLIIFFLFSACGDRDEESSGVTNITNKSQNKNDLFMASLSNAKPSEINSLFRKALKENIDLNKTDNEGKNIFHYLLNSSEALDKDTFEKIINLSSAMRYLNEKDKKGELPLDILTKNKNLRSKPELIEVLINGGMKFDTTNFLHNFVNEQSLEDKNDSHVIALIVNKHPMILSEKNAQGQTALEILEKTPKKREKLEDALKKNNNDKVSTNALQTLRKEIDEEKKHKIITKEMSEAQANMEKLNNEEKKTQEMIAHAKKNNDNKALQEAEKKLKEITQEKIVTEQKKAAQEKKLHDFEEKREKEKSTLKEKTDKEMAKKIAEETEAQKKKSQEEIEKKKSEQLYEIVPVNINKKLNICQIKYIDKSIELIGHLSSRPMPLINKRYVKLWNEKFNDMIKGRTLTFYQVKNNVAVSNNAAYEFKDLINYKLTPDALIYKEDEAFPNFANKFWGGGVLNLDTDHGNVQEEIQMRQSNALIWIAEKNYAKSHFTPWCNAININDLEKNPVVMKLDILFDFDNARGYGPKMSQLLNKDPSQVNTLLTPKAKPVQIYSYAMAAPKLKKGSQYTKEILENMYNTAVKAFYSIMLAMIHDEREEIIIHAGNWGAGAFGHSIKMSWAIQLLAYNHAKAMVNNNYRISYQYDAYGEKNEETLKKAQQEMKNLLHREEKYKPSDPDRYLNKLLVKSKSDSSWQAKQ
jgi:chemotaxis protein histidine kinase CheA